ncbi:GNAT family N-acetyltransferase [Streptomyces sp. NPDC044571]|uniref:GNAT family N-acetyltransferase n=1 Tax=Streptomyces sp. NPDC044571 TaxID=3155371 RepID=UPI0033DB93DD
MTITGPQSIELATASSARALRSVAHLDWSVPAAGLEWSCQHTAVHMARAFTRYGAQLTTRAAGAFVPVEVTAAPGTGPAGLIEVLEATAGLLSAAVAAARPGDRAWHPYGTVGPDGYAAVGVLEMLVHTRDILGGLGVRDQEPDASLCAQVLDLLFPQVPRGIAGPWQTLLWATGRGELPGLPAQRVWRWYGEPVPAGRVVLCELSPDVAADLRDGGTGGFAWTGDGPGEGTRVAAGMAFTAYEAGAYRPGWGPYAIVCTDDHRAIGGIGFHGSPDAEGNAEVGYDLVPSARGAGLVTDALAGLVAWAFAQPGLTALHATVDEGNAPSHGVLARVGFERTGAADGLVRHVLRAPRA